MKKRTKTFIIALFLLVGNLYSQSAELQSIRERNAAITEALSRQDTEEAFRLVEQWTTLESFRYVAHNRALFSLLREDVTLFKRFVDIWTSVSPEPGQHWFFEEAQKVGDLDLLKFLLERFEPTHTGLLLYAAETNNREMFDLLIDRVDVNNWHHRFDRYPETALTVASRNGNTEMMQALIVRGANLDGKTNDRNTYSRNSPLANALWSNGGHREAIELLLAHGATFRNAGEAEISLWEAATQGHFNVVKHIMERHADRINKNGQGNTRTIERTIKNGHTEVAAYLLEYLIFHHYHISQLSLAAAVGHMTIIEILLDRHKDDLAKEHHIANAILEASNHGQAAAIFRLLETGVQTPLTPQEYLEIAVHRGQPASAAFWIERGAVADALYRPDDRWIFRWSHRTTPHTLIEQAALYARNISFFPTSQHTAVVKLLAAHGAQLTPELISIAASHGDAEMIRFLVENGLQVEQSHLLSAVRNQRVDNVRLLLSLGLEADYRGRWQRTPLMEVVAYSYSEYSAIYSYSTVVGRIYDIAKALLQHGADVNARDFEGMTPLMFAAYAGHTRIVELLRTFGARINDTNNFGDPAAIFVRHVWVSEYPFLNTELLDIFGIPYTQEDIDNHFQQWHENRPLPQRPSQWDKDEKLVNAIRENNLEAVRHAINIGGDVLQDTSFQESYLAAISAAMNERWDSDGNHVPYGTSAAILMLLVENGMPVDAMSWRGTTPLIRAVMARDHAAVEFFIQRGANVNHINDYRNSPLVSAARNGDQRMIRLLVDNGARVDGDNGRTALRRAIEYHHYDVAELLRAFGVSLEP